MSKFSTMTRSIPAGAVEVTRPGVDAVAYLYPGRDRVVALGFRGKAKKPTFNYSFRTEAARAQYIDEFFQTAARIAQTRAERAEIRKAARAGGHSLNVGDVLYTSWGYDQTNIDFYEVVEVTSSQSVLVREVRQNSQATGHMSANVTPRRGDYCGEAIRAFWTGSCVKVAGRWTSQHDGSPKHSSWDH